MKSEALISGTREVLDHYLAAFRASPPVDEHGQEPESWDAAMTPHSLRLVITYPDPIPDTPDIPALVRAWHAEPTTDNADRLWRAIRDHGNHKGSRHASYCIGNVSYYASGDKYCPYLEVRQGV